MNPLEIADNLVRHFEQTRGIMHTNTEDTLSEMIKLRDWVAAQQSVHPTGSTGTAFQCPYCLRMVYPPHNHGNSASG